MVIRPGGRAARMLRRLESMGKLAAAGEDLEEAKLGNENTTPPPELAAVPPERIVDVDVRETLRAGGEPFGEIMAARRALPAGGVMRIRAIFEPVPLYYVLGSQGLDHWTERLADDDWRVWFFPSEASEPAAGSAASGAAPTVGSAASGAAPDAGSAASGAAPDAGSAAGATAQRSNTSDATAEDDVVILDVRGLEPPEPMVKTLEALETLPAGKTLVQINVRVPKFLLPMLEERGYTYEVREQDETLVRTFIRRRTA